MYGPETSALPKNTRVTLMNVRLSFSNVYEPKIIPDYPDSPASYRASFIIDPNGSHFQTVKKAVDDSASHFSGRGELKTNFASGDIKGYAGWLGNWILQASSSGTGKGPQVRSRNGQPSPKEEALFYPGCYVNAVIDIYWNQRRNRVCGDLKAIQFYNDGEELVGTPVEESFFKNYDESEPQEANTEWMNQIPNNSEKQGNPFQ